MSQSGFENAFKKATARQNAGDYEAAINLWRAILVQNPDYAPALNNLGVALRKSGRIAESEAVLRIGIERAPDQASLHLSLGQTLREWGNLEEAKTAFQKAGLLDPSLTAAHIGLGEMLFEDEAFDEAILVLKSVLQKTPNAVRAVDLLGQSYARIGDAPNAALVYAEAKTALGEIPFLSERMARLRLLAGDWETGFRGFAGDRDALSKTALDSDAPFWEGADLAGRRLAVTVDCGLSDMMVLLEMLKSVRGGPIDLIAPQDLCELLRATRVFDTVRAAYQPDTQERNKPGDKKGDAGVIKPDCWAPLSAIPRYISATPEAIHPGQTALFRPDAARLAPFRDRLPQTGIAIGLHWSNGVDPTGVDRHVPLKALAPLAEIPGVTLVSLQKGDAAREIAECGFPVTDWGPGLDNDGAAFVDTAAALSVLPLTIAVDGAVAHLACGLDRPSWVLVSACPTWPWGVDDDTPHPIGDLSAEAALHTAPWHPNARIYRRSFSDAWTSPIRRLAHDLKAFLQRLG